MKVTRIDQPGPAQLTGMRVNENPSESPRERAIRELVKGASTPTPSAPVLEASSPVSEAPIARQESAVAPAEPLAAAIAKAAESATSESAPQDETESKLAAQYAKLVQREKALRAREAQIKAQEDRLKPVETAPSQQTDLSKYIDRDSLKKDPFKVLNELGLGYEELTNLALNQPSPQDLASINKITSLEGKIAELEGKLNSTSKSFEETQQAQRQQAVAQISRDIKSLVDSNPEFETIKAAGAHAAVVKLIEKTFDEQGIMLDNEEAAREIEKTLFDKYSKIAQINKIKSQFGAAKEAAAQTVSKPEETKKPEQQQSIKTLTNAISPSRKLTRTERAIAAFKGQLQ